MALLGAAALVASIAGCGLIAWLTGSGFLGFGIALVGVLVVAGAAVCVREVRRAARGVGRVEHAARKLEKLVGAQGSTLQSVAATQLETSRAITDGLRAETLRADLTAQLQQEQAMFNLFALFPVRDVVPPMGGRDAAADVVGLLTAELLRSRPRLIVQCGSGVATLWMALAVEHRGLSSRIVSLDDDPSSAAETRRTLRAHGVERHAEVRDARLAPLGLDGHDTWWYDREALDGLSDIGLLFVDGPSEAAGPLVRYPAVPVFRDQLAPTATIVLDDTARAGERETAIRWRVQLPDFGYQNLPLHTGAARFTRSTSPSPG